MTAYNECKEWEGIQVGDLITAYHSGYHRLTKIERRCYTQYDIDNFSVYKDKQVGEEYKPLFHYEQVLTADYKKTKKKKAMSCDASYCKRVDHVYIAGLQTAFKEKMSILLETYREVSGARKS